MDKPETVISIDFGKCLPCAGLVCVGVCPLGVLEEGKDKKPRVVDVASCSWCGVCAGLCPQKAINVKQKSSAREPKHR
jgi:NAD-dependent dihydropyrimidine dehydrogenase PreA subunit